MIRCKNCRYLIPKESISLMAQFMGYTAECSLCNVLFNLEHIEEGESWCPLNASSSEHKINTQT